MRKIRRLTSMGVLAALTVVVAACGSPEPIRGQSTEPSVNPAPVGTNKDGVTTPRDVFGLACDQQPQGGTPGSAERVKGLPVGAAINANPQLTQLALALKKANLVDPLNQAPAITVFAPYDAAFTNFQQSVGESRFTQLLNNPNSLSTLLKYHVVARRYDRAGLVTAARVTSLQGAALTIRDAGQTMLVSDNAGNTAHVLCGNIPTANATVFIIDHVLQPDQPSSTP